MRQVTLGVTFCYKGYNWDKLAKLEQGLVTAGISVNFIIVMTVLSMCRKTSSEVVNAH